MISQAHVDQDLTADRLMDGTTVRHHAGISLRVQWVPGHAETTRTEVRRALAQLLAQITDPEDT